MHKGLILEINEKYAIIQSREKGLVKIKSKSDMKQGMEIYFFEEDLYKKESSFKLPYLAAAAVFIFALIIGSTNLNLNASMNIANAELPVDYPFAALLSIRT